MVILCSCLNTFYPDITLVSILFGNIPHGILISGMRMLFRSSPCTVGGLFLINIDTKQGQPVDLNFSIAHRRAYQIMRRDNRIQFMRPHNQIEFFVRVKADRSLECFQYDLCMSRYLPMNIETRLICLFWFHC